MLIGKIVPSLLPRVTRFGKNFGQRKKSSHNLKENVIKVMKLSIIIIMRFVFIYETCSLKLTGLTHQDTRPGKQ